MKDCARWLLLMASLAVLGLTGCGNDTGTPPQQDSPDSAAQDADGHTDAAKGPAEVPWNTYHGDFSLSGITETPLPNELTLAWRFLAGAPVVTTPVAGGARIYFVNNKGRIFAIDSQGNEIWSVAIPREARDKWSPKEQQFDAPLTYFRDTLLAGSVDGILFALDAASGEVKWQADLDGTILGAANVAVVTPKESGSESVRVYVIEQGSGVLHCLDFQTGQPVWQSQGVERCDGSPGVGGGTAVFGSCAAALHVFSAETGERLHDIPMGDESQVAGGVAVIDDEAYSGSRSGAVLKARTETGGVAWRNTDCTAEAFTTPAVDRQWVVFGCASGDVHGLERETGASKWTFHAGGLVTSAVIARDKVVAGSDGTLFLLRLEDGTKLWSHEVSDEITSPAIFDGLVIVGCDDGTVAAFR